MGSLTLSVFLVFLVVISAIFLILFIGCGRQETPAVQKVDYSGLLDRLGGAGFFQYVADGKVETVREDIQTSGYLFPASLGRYYFADAEDLAEWGVLDFFVDISPFLNKQGVCLPVKDGEVRRVVFRNTRTGKPEEVEIPKRIIDDTIPDENGIAFVRPVTQSNPEAGGDYTVTVGNHTRVIWSATLPEDRSWEAAACHTFLLVNILLEDARSQERIYGLYGGNEGGAVFLTREQFEMIRDSGLLDDSEMPWEPYEVAAE